MRRLDAQKLTRIAYMKNLTLQLVPSCVHYIVQILCTWVSRISVMGFIASMLNNRFNGNFRGFIAFHLMETRDFGELFLLRLHLAQNNP